MEEIKEKKVVVNTLIPLKSLSIFVLGTSVEDYLHLRCEYIPKEEWEVYSDTYTFPDFGVSVWTDIKTNKIIYAIKTDTSCVYNNHELINMPYNEFLTLVNILPDDISDIYTLGPKKNGRYYGVYYFDKLGLTLYVWRGRIRFLNITNYDVYVND